MERNLLSWRIIVKNCGNGKEHNIVAALREHYPALVALITEIIQAVFFCEAHEEDSIQ